MGDLLGVIILKFSRIYSMFENLEMEQKNLE